MTLLVGYAARPESEDALAAAAVEARLRATRLHVLWSHPEPTTSSGQRLRAWQAEFEEARKEAEGLQERLEGDDVDVIVELSAEPPSTALIEAANRLGAELLVIGVRRRTPVGKLMLGSVAQDVLLRAECPVLAVKWGDEAQG